MKNCLVSIAILLSVCTFLSPLTKAQITFYKTFGDSLTDRGECVVQTSDSGYVTASLSDCYAVGQTLSFKAYGKISLMKIDKYGDPIWAKNYSLGDNQSPQDLIETEDGGFIISGYLYQDPAPPINILIRTDLHGDTLWTRTYGTIVNIGRSNFQRIKDGSYILSGLFYGSDSNYYPTILKIDESGNIIWTKRYTQILTPYGVGIGITEAKDNGFMLTVNGSALLKTDSLGNLLWYKYLIPRDSTIPGGGSEFDLITQTNDEGYFLIGTKTAKSKYGGDLEYHLMVIKTNSEGDTLWTKKLGRITSLEERYYTYYPHSFDKLSDGGLVISGKGVYEAFLLRMDSSGNELWKQDFELSSYASQFESIKKTFDGGFIGIGMKKSSYSVKSDILLIKTDGKGNTTGVYSNRGKITSDVDFILDQNYPNPFNPSTRITYHLGKDSNVDLSIYNILGEKIITLVDKFQLSGSYSVDLNIKTSGLHSGIYIYSLKTDYNCLTRKMGLIK